MYYLQVQTVVILNGISLIQGFFHFSFQDFQNEYFHLNESILRTDPANWIEQPVDHFNTSDLRTWKQKYYEIMDYWKPEGPVLLFLGGEGPQMYGLLPLLQQIAGETGAACYLLEHRYYGNGTSQPLTPATTENLAFLSSRQALADAAHFLTTLKENPQFKNSKVIVVGGSYSANLAAWMKVLYPQLVDAVLASSAPVLAKKDYNEYYEAVTYTYKKYGSQECVDKITDKFNTFRELLKTPEGIEKLKKEHNICENNNMTVPENQQLFFTSKMMNFATSAQFDTPAKIISDCKDINVFKEKHKSFFWNTDDSCVDVDFSHLDIRFMRPWIYQTCTEFGYFQTTFSDKQMFGYAVPIDLYYKMCKLYFGEEFNEERVDQGVRNTNKLYGGLTPNVTNVVFVNGDMDPWHRLSIVQDLSADVPAVYIEGASHCHDLIVLPNDTENVKEAVTKIKNFIKKWIA